MPAVDRTDLLTFAAPDGVAKNSPAELPLGMAVGVRLTIEGSDLAAVEAAAVEMKVRFGSRFAVMGRKCDPSRNALRITAALIANSDNAMDAESTRQWALLEAVG
jgi:hypothetical protein